MTLPTAPGVFDNWGLVTDTPVEFEDWGPIFDGSPRFVDWENAAFGITSTLQITKPIDKMWAFIGMIEQRDDDDRRG